MFTILSAICLIDGRYSEPDLRQGCGKFVPQLAEQIFNSGGALRCGEQPQSGGWFAARLPPSAASAPAPADVRAAPRSRRPLSGCLGGSGTASETDPGL